MMEIDPPVYGRYRTIEIDDTTPASKIEVNVSKKCKCLAAAPSAGNNPSENVPNPSLGKQSWSRPIEFLLTCISMSVGLGNTFRFPLVAFTHGGGSFLVPYAIVTFLVGYPLYFLEMCLGQFSSLGAIQAWSITPIFRGVGYTAVLGTACVLSYYVSLMALAVYYLVASFHSHLPWTQCSTEWMSTELCVDGVFQFSLTNSSLSQYYYTHKAFPQLTNIDNGIGSPNLTLAMCLLGSWILILISQINGIKNSGKLAYFTSIFPYCVLVVLLFRAITFNGGWDGVRKFISPDWTKILDSNVWIAAVAQCFYSLSAGSGSVITLASHNTLKHNVYRDSLLVCLMDSLNSILAGLTTYAVMGVHAANRGLPLQEVLTGNIDFAFTSFPDTISSFAIIPQLFPILFYLMLISLALGSSSALAGGIVTVIREQFPRWKLWPTTLAVCFVGFFTGLIYVTPAGPFLVTLVDSYPAGFVIYVAVILEITAICGVYGFQKFCFDLEFMLKKKIRVFVRLCWTIIIPVTLSFALIASLQDSTRLTYKSQEFPMQAMAAGWIMATLSLLLIPFFAVVEVCSAHGDTLNMKIRASTRPTKLWGPKSNVIRKEWIEHKGTRDNHRIRL